MSREGEAGARAAAAWCGRSGGRRGRRGVGVGEGAGAGKSVGRRGSRRPDIYLFQWIQIGQKSKAGGF